MKKHNFPVDNLNIVKLNKNYES